MTYGPRQGGREIVLIDQETIAAGGAKTSKGINPKWSKDPRLQLLVEDGIFGSAPVLSIDIEHWLISEACAVRLGQFVVSANGVYSLYTEDLVTRVPFPMVRANITGFVDMTSAKLTLVLTGDQS